MSGVPCLRGTRIPVAMIVRMVADGTAVEQLLEEYPQLTADDIRDAARLALPHRRRKDPLDPPGTDEERLDDALDQADSVIEEGQVLGLVGKNGAGKTSLLKIIAGLLFPDRGSCRTLDW